MSTATRTSRLFTAQRMAILLGLLLLGLCVYSLYFYGRLNAWTPSQNDWREAAAAVKAEFKPGDMVAIVPFWATTGERAFVEAGLPYRYVRWVAREDWPGAGRLWVVNGYERFSDRRLLEDLGWKKDGSSRHGALNVDRFVIPDGDAPTYDFWEHLPEANVTMQRGKRTKSCGKWNTKTLRYDCAKNTTWNYVGRLKREIGFGIRDTIWAHPVQNGAIKVAYKNVPATNKLVIHSGLTLYAVSHPEGAPVTITVFVDGQKLGEAVCPNESGWHRSEFSLLGLGDGPHDVQFDISTPHQGRRHFVFNAWAQ